MIVPENSRIPSPLDMEVVVYDPEHQIHLKGNTTNNKTILIATYTALGVALAAISYFLYWSKLFLFALLLILIDLVLVVYWFSTLKVKKNAVHAIHIQKSKVDIYKRNRTDYRRIDQQMIKYLVMTIKARHMKLYINNTEQFKFEFRLSGEKRKDPLQLIEDIEKLLSLSRQKVIRFENRIVVLLLNPPLTEEAFYLTAKNYEPKYFKVKRQSDKIIISQHAYVSSTKAVYSITLHLKKQAVIRQHLYTTISYLSFADIRQLNIVSKLVRQGRGSSDNLEATLLARVGKNAYEEVFKLEGWGNNLELLEWQMHKELNALKEIIEAAILAKQ